MIDLSEAITAAGGRGRSGAGWIAATQKLREFHGAGSNESGVFVSAETIALAEEGRTIVKIRVARTGRCWLFGYDFQNATHGAGGGPSVWDRWGYETRDDAIKAGAEKARAWLQSEVDSLNSCTSTTTRAEARKCIAQIDDTFLRTVPKAVQLDMFGGLTL